MNAAEPREDTNGGHEGRRARDLRAGAPLVDRLAGGQGRGEETVQRCNCGGAACKSAKVSEGVEGETFGDRVTGLSRREPGSGVLVRVQVQDLNFAPHPYLYLITRA